MAGAELLANSLLAEVPVYGTSSPQKLPLGVWALPRTLNPKPYTALGFWALGLRGFRLGAASRPCPLHGFFLRVGFEVGWRLASHR